MERTELAKLLSHISDIYRQFEFPKETDSESKRFIESWNEYVGKYDYDDARQALRLFTDENPKWPPNAPELQRECHELVERKKRIEWAKRQEMLMEQEEHNRISGQTEGDNNGQSSQSKSVEGI